jgi:hypothetical protein
MLLRNLDPRSCATELGCEESLFSPNRSHYPNRLCKREWCVHFTNSTNAYRLAIRLQKAPVPRSPCQSARPKDNPWKLLESTWKIPCFSHGQLYVACSRMGNPINLYILAPEEKTKNTDYPTALQWNFSQNTTLQFCCMSSFCSTCRTIAFIYDAVFFFLHVRVLRKS